MEEFKGSKGKWSVGKGHTVVTDSSEGFLANTGHTDTEYYGGNLIGESIQKLEDRQLISAAPDLLDACKQIINANATMDKAELSNGLLSAARAINKALGQE